MFLLVWLSVIVNLSLSQSERDDQGVGISDYLASTSSAVELDLHAYDDVQLDEHESDGATSSLSNFLSSMILAVVGESEADSHEGPQFDAFFVRPAHSTRDFVVGITAGAPHRNFLVVFDTGSPSLWIASSVLAMSYHSPKPGYPIRRNGLPMTVGHRFLNYMHSVTHCAVWYHGRISTSFTQWQQDFCVAVDTTVHMAGFLGVLGANLSSQFVSQNPIFWLVPIGGKVALSLHDLSVEQACSTDLAVVPLTRRVDTMNHWEFLATVSFDLHDPVAVYASPDTGTDRLFLNTILWNQLVDLLDVHGISLMRNHPSSSYYSPTGCQNIRRLPTISIGMGSFLYQLHGRDYAKYIPRLGVCVFKIFDLPDENELILIGSDVLKKITSRWDSENSTISFCSPI